MTTKNMQSKAVKILEFIFFRKKGWDGVKMWGYKENLQNFFNFFKRKPNIKGILMRHITNTALLLQEATQKS